MASYELLNCQLPVRPKGLEAFTNSALPKGGRCCLVSQTRCPWGTVFPSQCNPRVLLDLCTGGVKSLGDGILAAKMIFFSQYGG